MSDESERRIREMIADRDQIVCKRLIFELESEFPDVFFRNGSRTFTGNNIIEKIKEVYDDVRRENN